MSRIDKDYAIEFGEYLAKAADNLLDAANRRDQLKQEEAPEEMQDQAGEAYSDHFSSLRNAAYEFRKRAERAKASAVPEVARIDQSASNDLLNKIAVRPQDTWTPQEVSQLFLFACGCHNLIAAKSSPATEAGPLGGFAPVGPAAVELDFMLTQFQNELQTAMDDATSVEDSCYHDGEALKLKRQIIDRFAPSPQLFSGDGMSAGRFHCACVFSRTTDFSEAVLERECAFHSTRSKRGMQA